MSLSDEQLADLAFQGFSVPIKDRFFCHEFDSLAHLAQEVSAYESRLQEAEEDHFGVIKTRKKIILKHEFSYSKIGVACVNIKIW